MKEFFDKAWTWIKSNMLISIIGAAVVTMLFFPKLLKLGTTRRRRRRLATAGRSYGVRYRKPRKPYTKGGKAKKPWQIKGSLAARRHMAQIRRRKRG